MNLQGYLGAGDKWRFVGSRLDRVQVSLWALLICQKLEFDDSGRNRNETQERKMF